jgi:hypothetical protein
MPTDANIGNMALSRLGTRATIADLTENSTEARQLSIWYETVRDDLQGMMDWNFNRVTRALSLSGTAPTRWTYSYAYPSDALKVWRLDFGDAVWAWPDPVKPFEIASDGDNQFLYCNESVVEAVLLQRVTDPNRFSAAFVLAFADALAAAVAYPITQKRDVAAQLQQVAAARLEKAMTDSANEQGGQNRFPTPESLAVRGVNDRTLYWLDGIYR